MKNLILAFIFIVLGQAISFIQLQGQFINEWMKKNTWAMVLFGLPISWMLIKFTKYCAMAFDGEIWPGRLIGFAIGAIVFTIMSHYIFKEPITTKTAVCLVLASAILCVQIFWK
jgi:membrane protease YdiL (CAAX protease family)